MTRRTLKHGIFAIHLAVAGLMLLGFASAAPAAYPTKPVNLVVNYGPGGGTDLPARALSSVIGDYLGQPMIVMNKPGGGAQIGTNFVSKAKPDGYTLLISYGGLEQTLAPHVRKLPYDPMKGFIPLTPISIYDGCLAVRADAPWKTAQELVEYAKANPGKIKFGRSSTFGTNHMLSMLFKKATGIQMKVNIPFKSGSKTMAGVLGGDCDAAFLGHPISVEQYKAGKLRILASSGDKRNAFTPELPTFKELGWDVVLGNVKGIAVPAGTAPEIVAKLHDAILKSTASKPFKRMMKSFHQPVVTMSQAEFAQFVKDQYKFWGEFIVEMGLK